MKYLFILIILLSSFFISSCGHTSPVRTIPENQKRVNFSIGGPVIPLAGLPIPLPYLNVGYMVGAKQNVTYFGNAHVTAIAFKDVALDGGLVTSLVREKGMRPELTLKLQGNAFWDAFRGHTFIFLPVATINGSYSVSESSIFYFGLDNAYQLSNGELFHSPLCGYWYAFNESVNLICEVKWIAANKNTQHGIFEGMGSIGGKGNVGLFFGMEFTLLP